MEIRKVQKTGGASYIISLPKTWADELGIKEQDKVGIIQRDDGTLVIIPKIDQEQDQRVKDIDIDGIDHDRFLYRLLVGTYIMGYNSIRLHSSTRIDNAAKTTARKFIRDAIGLEVIEETSTSMTLKDLLNPSEMKFRSWIERMSQLVTNQLEEAFRALIEKDADAAKAIIARDGEVNRLHWLISRQHNIMTRNVVFAEMVESNEKQLANYPLVSKIMERIGDYAVRISENNIRVLDKGLDKKIIDTIVKAGRLALSIFNRSIDAFFSGNLSDTNQIIESVKDLVAECEKIENIALEQETVIGVSLGYINEAIRRTGEHASDLCEYILDYLLDKQAKVKK
nr:PhoU domain-containing protein [Candidatus Sigynarchaeota archaeon]